MISAVEGEEGQSSAQTRDLWWGVPRVSRRRQSSEKYLDSDQNELLCSEQTKATIAALISNAPLPASYERMVIHCGCTAGGERVKVTHRRADDEAFSRRASIAITIMHGRRVRRRHNKARVLGTAHTSPRRESFLPSPLPAHVLHILCLIRLSCWHFCSC